MKRYWLFLAGLCASMALLLVACSPAPSVASSTPQSSPAPTKIAALAPTALQQSAPTTAPPAVSTPTSLPSPNPAPSLTPSPTPLGVISSTFTPSATSGPAASPPSAPRLVVLAQNQPGPDDLVLAPDGTIYFSDVGDDTIKRLDQNGQVTVVLSGLQEPEGLVFLPDGSLVVAEQKTNRLLRYDFNTRRLSTFLQLTNKTGRMGVDGIVFDVKTQTLLVPDSPNDTLLRVSVDGKSVQTIARGLVRPTGAAVEADGSILVVDENGGDLRRIPPTGGAPQVVARIPSPDDVIVDSQGNIYVNGLGGVIRHVDARTGQQTIIRGDLSDPQGIIFDGEGNLIVADAGSHRVVKIVLK